jgi:U2-associated protein SR140
MAKSLLYVYSQPLDAFHLNWVIPQIKVMWPRGDGGPGDALSNRRSKSGGLTGFVSFKRRKEAELALRKLDGADWVGSVLRVGWSKAVPTSGRVLYGQPMPVLPSLSRSD